ncbi:ABC transporter substrate-binding protein [Micromonospora sp. WMMD558]|uniref:ABC transporter substrate-binding protein n=1 Tax=unclassified Micromonospora TaxID=2617518 RepID=UPI0012B4513A|nr:ABC transporter substrate-binding protein [Micromonospora sp. WMMC415]QGN46223.1 ABC transporter substrate-binding protein [Micromonospora sp. WMMC415]
MSQMNRRRALQLLAALGTTGLVGGCGTDDSGADSTPTLSPIKIGLVAPQTGDLKVIGTEIINGFQLFLDLNQAQLGGHPTELLTAEEGGKPESGKAAVEGLLKQGVLALTGVASSAVMLGIRDTVEQARVPLVGSNASPTSLQSVVYIWRTSYVLDEAGRALGSYLRTRLPASAKLAIVMPKGLASEDVLRGFRQEFGESDPRIEDPVTWTTDAVAERADYATDIDRALDAEPTAMFCFFNGEAAVKFIKQLRDAGFRGTVYAPGFLTEGKVLESFENTPGDALGIQTALNYSADINNAANRLFASAYRKKHGSSPTTYAMASYDAAQVLDQAIRIAGDSPTPQQVNLALGRVGQIDSPRGVWQFNQPRTPQQKWYLREVQMDGQVLSNVLITELATLG